MLHLWSLATWSVEITHDAGKPEWIGTPVTNWYFDNLSTYDDESFDGEKWTLRLPETLQLLTAWYMDEHCEHLYFTCIDPRGVTLHRMLDELDVHEDIPKLNIGGLPLTHLWYTVDGFYTFTFTYFYGGMPYQHFGSFRMMLAQREDGHE